MLEPNRIYSARQLAKVLHISTRKIYYMVHQDKIPYVRITPASHIQFPGWQIRQWLDTKMEGGTKKSMAGLEEMIQLGITKKNPVGTGL